MNREHSFTLEQFQQIIAFGSDDGMQKKWRVFTKKLDVKMDEFPVILQTISHFLEEPYTAVLSEQVFEKQWKANHKSWM